MIDNKKVKAVKNIVLRGIVRHSEIRPKLARAEIQNINPDDIAQLSIDYKLRGKKVYSRIFEKIFSFINLILTMILACAGGLAYAEFTASSVFSKTALNGKLSGFGDNILYWLGMKKIELSASDMFNAVLAVIKATPMILKSFLIGFFFGLVGWIILTNVWRFVYKRSRLNYEIKNLLKKNIPVQQNSSSY